MNDDRFLTFLFDTTDQAVWAEDVARERGIPAEVVSAPAWAEDKCGMALRTFRARAPELGEAFGEEGIPYSTTDGRPDAAS